MLRPDLLCVKYLAERSVFSIICYYQLAFYIMRRVKLSVRQPLKINRYPNTANYVIRSYRLSVRVPAVIYVIILYHSYRRRSKHVRSVIHNISLNNLPYRMTKVCKKIFFC